MIRKKKRYERPKKAFEISRIKEENALMKKYALKNKLEVWKSIAKVDYFRRRAKALAKSSPEEQEVLFRKLRVLGLKADSIADVLAMKLEDILERRLPTIVFKKGFAKTPQEARQMVAHKKVMIENKVIDVPSYLVSLSEENQISIKKKVKQEAEAPNTKAEAPQAQIAEIAKTEVKEK
ncbi:MAG: 30S ribosomal protein S4 [Candidatus Pacearchaeota archaeon]